MAVHVDLTSRPDLYDWLYSEHSEDIPMYITLADGHSKVLECGVGSGRTAIPMAQSGKIVCGIDNSKPMLESLATKLLLLPDSVRRRIEVHHADMREFNLGQIFTFAYVPFSTFNYLLTIDDQKAALRALRNHISEDGTVVIELLSFSLFPNWLNNDQLIRKVARRVDQETGKLTEMWRVVRFDSAKQLVEQDRHYRLYNTKGELENEITVLWQNRFFLLGEMQLLLEMTGFKTMAVYGDCQLGPYRHESEFAIVVAKAK